MKRLALLLVFVVAMSGCGLFGTSGTTVPARFEARATVALVATVAQSAGDTCAKFAGAWKAAGDERWKPLATKCADGYDVARGALVGAQAALDSYDSAQAGKVACAVLSALEGADEIVSAMDSAGILVPPSVILAVSDAHKVAQWAVVLSGGVCYQPIADTGTAG